MSRIHFQETVIARIVSRPIIIGYMFKNEINKYFSRSDHVYTRYIRCIAPWDGDSVKFQRAVAVLAALPPPWTAGGCPPRPPSAAGRRTRARSCPAGTRRRVAAPCVSRGCRERAARRVPARTRPPPRPPAGARSRTAGRRGPVETGRGRAGGASRASRSRRREGAPPRRTATTRQYVQ